MQSKATAINNGNKVANAHTTHTCDQNSNMKSDVAVVPDDSESQMAPVTVATAVNRSYHANIFLERFFGAFQWEEFACGCGSAFVNIAVTYPIYKIIFRQMLHGVPVGSALLQLRHEGLGFLYRGMLPPLAQKPSRCPLCLEYLMERDVT